MSLYVTYDEATLEVKEQGHQLERVPVAVNFRHDKLDHIVTEEPGCTPKPSSDRKHARSLAGQA